MKGLLVFIFRNASGTDCTNRGVSSQYKEALLVGEGVPEIFEVSEKRPTLKLVKRDLAGGEYLHVEPIGRSPGTFMAGGNFVWSSDSRFPNRYPLSIHDREE